ncbi:MAG: ATP-binding protein, partial [Burkholderiales bacterium]|nr:ATP-binding protein [Burkholderiales bacterium]
STEGVEVPGRVAVTLDGDADHVELTVDDNGIGMDAVTRDRLFEPFMQAEASTTRRFGGTGLGLAITRRLVDLMHGDIEVTSAPERGSRFRVRVPVETVARATPAPAPDLTGVQCVIVTDDILPVAIVREWLAGAGASIVEVPDVAAAAARLAHLPAPRVVILRTAVIADVLATLGTDADPGVLVVARGRRGGARQVAPRAAALDWLRRSALQQAVAALSGRASPIVSLPVARETVRAASPTFASDIGRAQAEGRLILVAEDDAINRAVISRQLAVLGHAAVVAEDGEVALDLWRSGRFALLLTDLHMPVIDGYALTRRIRAEEAARVGGRRTPVVMLTANAMKGEEDRAREAGVDDYLTKPVPLDGLGEVIARWLPAAPGATGAADTGPRDADPASPLLDLDVLRALVGGDEDAVRDLLGEYARSVGRLASELADALRAGDGPQAGALAHKLKSASQSVGAVALARTCAALERDRTGADPAEQPHVLEHFEALVRDTLTRVHRQLGELG